MSLKPFHIVLILTAISLGVGLGFWSLGRYTETQNQNDLYMGIISFAIGLGIAGYLVWFLKKMKQKGW